MTGLELPAIGAIAGLASSGVSAYGTIAGGKSDARASLASARAQSQQARAMGNIEARTAMSTGRAQGVQAIMSAVAEAQGLVQNIPLLQMRAKTERLAGEVEGSSLRMSAKEELAQGSSNMLQARRLKNMVHSKATANAAASGFTATDATALRVSDDIERYGSVQEGMELYGGLSRSDALRSSAAAREHYGVSQGLASLMEAESLRQAGLTVLDAGRYTSKTAISTAKMVAANARATGGRSSMYALQSGAAAASGARTGSYLTAGATILGGASTFASKYDKEKGWFQT